MINTFYILLGITLLYFGGELLVRFSSSLALRLRLSPLVIGLTVVAFGTSAPELAATLSASLNGSPMIGFGNVIGSNISNIGFILGLCAILVPITTSLTVLRQEIPLMLLISLLPMLWFIDGVMSRTEGVITFALLIAYLVFVLLRSKYSNFNEIEIQSSSTPLQVSVFGILGGLVLLVIGANVLVEGASAIARIFGVPEKVIGLTLVAVGTSLPELASSLIAILKGKTDMVLGNIIGSNIFNILGILGLTSIVIPFELAFNAVRIDILIMLVFGFTSFIFLLSQKKLARWEGVILLSAYVIYIGWLF